MYKRTHTYNVDILDNAKWQLPNGIGLRDGTRNHTPISINTCNEGRRARYQGSWGSNRTVARIFAIGSCSKKIRPCNAPNEICISFWYMELIFHYGDVQTKFILSELNWQITPLRVLSLWREATRYSNPAWNKSSDALFHLSLKHLKNIRILF